MDTAVMVLLELLLCCPVALMQCYLFYYYADRKLKQAQVQQLDNSTIFFSTEQKANDCDKHRCVLWFSQKESESNWNSCFRKTLYIPSHLIFVQRLVPGQPTDLWMGLKFLSFISPSRCCMLGFEIPRGRFMIPQRLLFLLASLSVCIRLEPGQTKWSWYGLQQ